MPVLLRIVWISHILVPILAVLCNILLLCLIKIVKTKTLIHLKYSLIPNCILDIAVSVTTFIVAPHVFHIDGNIYVVYGDLFGPYFDKYVACHFGSLFAALSTTSVISTACSFYIRYLVICKQQKVSIRTMILPYFLLFINFANVYLLFLWFYLSASGYPKTEQASFLEDLWKKEFVKSPLYFSEEVLSPIFVRNGIYFLISFNFAYGLIFYYSIQISKTLKAHSDSSSSNVIKLIHKQIQRALFIQAFGPSLIGSLPLLLIISKNMIELKSEEIASILSLFFPWMLVANPAAAIIFIKPYRNYLKSLFNKAVSKKSSQRIGATISPITQNIS